MHFLQADFWNERYLNNETGWDLGSVSPPLAEYINQLTNKQLHILIPGCGNAYEAGYLLERGFEHITLLDLSDIAAQRLREKYKDKPITIICKDFFEHRGKYDLILEQTFFCALHPTLRNKYVEQMHSLLNDRGILAGLLFNCRFDKEGPPFGGEKKEYLALFEPFFEIKQMRLAENSVKPRQGNELFIELIKKDIYT
jgi:SAM-dependent methyltransferase